MTDTITTTPAREQHPTPLNTPRPQAPEGYAYGFVQHSRAWYAEACKLPDGVTDELMVGLYADEGGCRWEFAIRWHNLPEITPRVEVFSDAWEAFAELPEVFAELGRRDTLAPRECCEMLEGFGLIDRTPAGQGERTPGQQPTELNTPWTLHFDRDGTEDYGIICGADGEELVASHLPGTSFGERTFETGTFWLPEKNDPTPQRVRQMQVMVAAPKLLEALSSAERFISGFEGDEMQEGVAELLAAVQAVIAEATEANGRVS